MESEDTSTSQLRTVPLSSGAPNSGKKKRNRNRNRNRSTVAPQQEGGEMPRVAHQSKSRSPPRNHGKSKSPMRGGKSQSPLRSKSSTPPHNHLRSKHYHHHHHHQNQQRNHHLDTPADLTVICRRSDLWDSAAHFQPDDSQLHHNHHHHNAPVIPFFFSSESNDFDHSNHAQTPDGPGFVAVARVPHHFEKSDIPLPPDPHGYCDVVDTTIPNPHDPEVVHDKYWAQRRRLFSRFDMGIQLDGQGWYSVTPEIIADHVANRVAELATNHVIPHESEEGIVILDAFCGCGGNSIAFGKVPSNIISKVVCVDTDRSKLLKAAHNASLYDIPRDKLVFVECNSIFILQHCYKDGQFILDQPTATLPPYMPPPVMHTVHAGYHVGGLDMLPRRIDAVFMDPPWGGIDYEVLGKNGYDLQKNMKIQVGLHHPPHYQSEDEYEADGDGCDDFFDTFVTAKPKSKLSQKARKQNFNKHTDGENFIDGMELLKVAARAVSARVVVFDLPRNINRTSLGKCALQAGYRGNIKLEEHYLNGRLKTVTAYMGADYSDLINTSIHEQPHAVSTGTVSCDEA